MILNYMIQLLDLIYTIAGIVFFVEGIRYFKRN